MVGTKRGSVLEKAGLEYKEGVYLGPAKDLAGTRFEYAGLTTADMAVTPAGQTVDLTKLATAALNDDDVLILSYKDGHVDYVQPDVFTDMMKMRFRNISNNVNAVYAMPKSDSELNDIFILIFPDYKSKLFYDLLRERERLDLSLLDPDMYEPGSFVDYNDEIECLYFDRLERRLRALGCKGNFPSTEVRRRVIMAKFYEMKRNPFQEWLESLVWDGESRVDTWFQKVFNATAPPLEEYGLGPLYLAKVSRAWFCGAVARVYRPTVHEVVPVLIGGQGMGKTSGLRYTAGKDEWFIDTTVDVANPGGKTEFLDTVRGRVIVEMSEGTQIRTKDQDRLKAFISMKEDQYRKPYARRDNTFPRHFILAASSNLDDVFTDLTGNRRYYPMYCHEAIFSDRNAYDREQVWAEAKAMYDKGEQCYIDSKWFPAMIMQEYATADNANVSMIETYLDNPNNDNGMYTRVGAIITKEEAMYKIFGRAHVLANSPEDHAWRSWIKGTRCWEKTEQPISVAFSSKPQRAYRRIRSPMQGPYLHGTFTKESKGELLAKCIDEARFSIPLGGDQTVPSIERKFRGKTPADIYKMICIEQNITDVYATILIDDLMPETQRLLLDNGFIFYDKAKEEYRTVVPLNE